MGKNVDKNISKSLNGKYSPGMLAVDQKHFDRAKQSAVDPLKTKKQQRQLVI